MFALALLPAGIWVGKRQRKVDETWTLQELRDEGFKYVEWDGRYVACSYSFAIANLLSVRTPRVLTDDAGRIIAVLGGSPDDPKWGAAVAGAEAAMVHARVLGKRNGAIPSRPEDLKHRRGVFAAIPTGVSFGGGQVVSLCSFPSIAT